MSRERRSGKAALRRWACCAWLAACCGPAGLTGCSAEDDFSPAILDLKKAPLDFTLVDLSVHLPPVDMAMPPNTGG